MGESNTLDNLARELRIRNYSQKTNIMYERKIRFSSAGYPKRP